jgi:hypothetical protein
MTCLGVWHPFVTQAQSNRAKRKVHACMALNRIRSRIHLSSIIYHLQYFNNMLRVSTLSMMSIHLCNHMLNHCSVILHYHQNATHVGG